MQTLNNITQRAHERGIELRRDDVRFVLEVVSEADPWFEQGASAEVFASRFRTFVVARCRGQGLNLTADELDLIDAWFLGMGMAQRLALRSTSARSTPGHRRTAGCRSRPARADPEAADERWLQEDARGLKTSLREALSSAPQAPATSGTPTADELPPRHAHPPARLTRAAVPARPSLTDHGMPPVFRVLPNSIESRSRHPCAGSGPRSPRLTLIREG